MLLVLTPDESKPAAVAELKDRPIAWASFAALDQAIDELVKDDTEVVSEREGFLLRELRTMLSQEGLVAASKEIVVVAAHDAWPEYLEYNAYVCQPNRSFQPVRRIAFYTDGAIQNLVPQILNTREEVVFEKGAHDGAFGAVVDRMLAENERDVGQSSKIMLLSAPDDARTLKLERPIHNDLVADSGRVTAFTQNQRYVRDEKLRSASRTSQLV